MRAQFGPQMQRVGIFASANAFASFCDRFGTVILPCGFFLSGFDIRFFDFLFFLYLFYFYLYLSFYNF